MGKMSKTEERHYVTIQNAEGSYGEMLIVDNSNNYPLQKQIRTARYRIQESPRLMRNVPKFYPAKELAQSQVLKFDIRDPGPFGRIWHREMHS